MTILEARVPTRAPGLELLGAQQGSGYQEAPAAVRRPDGQTIQVTPLLYQLLEAVDGARDLDQLADELSARTGKRVTAENVHVLLEEKLAPLGLVCDEGGDFREFTSPTPLLALRWKFVISDPAITRRITAPFAALFRPWIVAPVLVAFAATCVWVLFRHGLASATRQAFDTPGLLLAVFALTVVSAGWHEFGHAAACRAAGATPGAMGAGLYLVWPAFYTDVDDAYRLDRRGRLTVDLGGLYFNAVVAVAIMAAWLVTDLDALLLVVATQLLQMLRQLAPVIRADGYHILSDLIGVPDLFHHIKPTLAGLLPTNWGKPQPLRRGPRWVVRAWVLTVVPLLLWLMAGMVLLLPRLAATAWLGLHQQQRFLTASFVGGDVLGVGAALLQMFSLVLPVAAGTYLVARIVRRTVRKVWRSTEDHPGRRAAVMLLGGLIVLALALAWWPSGQYEPVSAAERGTIDRVFQLSSARGPVTEAPDTNDASAAPPRPSTFRPIAGVEPRTGYALVPRDPDESAVLLVHDDDGQLRTVVTDGDATTGEVRGVAFPFELPAAPRPGVDNQALAVNTGDGTVVYDIAVALVWMTDGEVVDNRNEAYALASCTNCTTVAVAFQVVLVVGQSDTVAPVNVAVAANGGCLACQTTALAIQLVVTLNDLPSEEVQRELEAALDRLDDAGSLQELYDEIQVVQREVVDLLQEEGLIDAHNQPTSSSEVDTSESTTTTVGASSDDAATSSSSVSTTTSTTVRSSTTSTTTSSSTTTSTSTTTSSTTTTTEPQTSTTAA